MEAVSAATKVGTVRFRSRSIQGLPGSQVSPLQANTTRELHSHDRKQSSAQPPGTGPGITMHVLKREIDELRREIADVKRRLEERDNQHCWGHPASKPPPTTRARK
jgi:hypothetical protein